MGDVTNQQEWLDGLSPADDWDAHATRRVLDELFCYARQYRSSQSYDGLLKFVARFRFYSPYNAMLVGARCREPVSSRLPTVGAGSTGGRSRSMPDPWSSSSRWAR